MWAWTMGRRLAGMTAVALVATAVVGAAGWRGITSIHAANHHMLVTQTAMRSHMDADMMHDAIRADVLGSLLARTAEQKAGVRADLTGHVHTFRQDLAANVHADLDPALRAEFDAAAPALDAYIRAAEEIVGTASVDLPRALGMYAVFLSSFRQLETKMKDLSDRVDESASSARDVGDKAADRAHNRILGLGMLSLVALGALAALMARAIVEPLRRAAQTLDRVADGDLTSRMNAAGSDEIAQLGRALDRACDAMRDTFRTIDSSASRLAQSSDALAETSLQMTSNAEETSAQAQVVSSAADEVSRNIQSAATGAESVSRSFEEIARNVGEAARMATDAVTVAEQTNATVSKLGVSSAEIGNVLKMITSVAEQTNLLALNATIEAARAGDAGKGFAVVANEVKELAKETARATDDIGRKIEAIQADSQSAVGAIAAIGAVIRQMHEISGQIAVAVNDQANTTARITQSVAGAAEGGADIARNIGAVAQAAQGTSGGASEARRAAEQLAQMAGELRSAAGRFQFDRNGGDRGGTEPPLSRRTPVMAAARSALA